MSRKVIFISILVFIILLFIAVFFIFNNYSISGNAIIGSSIKCSDSDGGLNYFQKGVVKYNGRSFTDTCNKNYLTEWYCQNQWFRIVASSKGYKCALGCKDGACIKNTCGNGIVDSGEECDDKNLISLDGCSNICKIEIVCNDSDGDNWYTKGTTTESINGVIMPGRNAEDYCNDANTLTEYECTEPFYMNYKLHMSQGLGGKCPYGCEDGACREESIELQTNCYESKKSGLCGPEESILPLNNSAILNSIRVYGPGLILENNDFRLSFESPQFLTMKTQISLINNPKGGQEYISSYGEYNLTIIIENKKNEYMDFNYSYTIPQGLPSQEVYGNIGVDNLLNSEEITSGKIQHYKNRFAPLETKRLIVHVFPSKPTMVDSSIMYLLLNVNPQKEQMMNDISFQAWIKPDLNYLTVQLGNGGVLVPPEVTECGGILQPLRIIEPTEIDGERSYGYSQGKCCNQTFFPTADCCTHNDCLSKEYSDGYCVDGKCMGVDKSPNKLFGSKKVLVSTEFNTADTCQITLLSDLSSEIISDISVLNEYYDYEANLLLSQPSDFVDFSVESAIKLPSSFIGYFKPGDSEEELRSRISSMCNIDLNQIDILILPAQVYTNAQAGAALGGVGTGKTLIYSMGNKPTLIHEVGHIFGCTDTYTSMWGHLQLAYTLYGQKRVSNADNPLLGTGPYNFIETGRIGQLPIKTFQLCRGEMGWTDNNKNGIVDVKEW
jgi:cysteine-rich repeat protein